MTRMIKTLNAAIFSVALLTGISSAHAQGMAPGHPGNGHAGMGHHAMMKNALMSIPNLTTEQRQRVTDLLNTAKTQTAPLREQIVAARKEMAMLWAADTLDKPAITAKQGEIEGALSKIKTIWADFFMQLHDVLTSPQRAWLTVHGPGMHDNSDFGMGCPCNQQQEK